MSEMNKGIGKPEEFFDEKTMDIVIPVDTKTTIDAPKKSEELKLESRVATTGSWELPSTKIVEPPPEIQVPVATPQPPAPAPTPTPVVTAEVTPAWYQQKKYQQRSLAALTFMFFIIIAKYLSHTGSPSDSIQPMSDTSIPLQLHRPSFEWKAHYDRLGDLETDLVKAYQENLPQP